MPRPYGHVAACWRSRSRRSSPWQSRLDHRQYCSTSALGTARFLEPRRCASAYRPARSPISGSAPSSDGSAKSSPRSIQASWGEEHRVQAPGGG